MWIVVLVKVFFKLPFKMNEIPLWMERLVQQDVDAEKDDGYTPMQLLGIKSRRFIWWLCMQYNVMPDGVMGSACNLLERYLAKKVLIPNLSPNSPKWQEIKNDITIRTPLLASVCIALSSKMRSASRHVNVKDIRSVLDHHFSIFTIPEIENAEMDVLSTIGFKIPLYTNVEKAEVIAVDIDMSDDKKLEAVALVTQITELHRPYIQEKVEDVALTLRNEKTSNVLRNNIKNVRHVHLVAGALAATRSFLKWQSRDPVHRLAYLTQCSPAYIIYIRDIILGVLEKEFGQEVIDMGVPRSRKRHWHEKVDVLNKPFLPQV